MRGSLLEDDVEILDVALFELLLQEATTMLILAQSVDLLSRHGLQVVVHEARGVCG